MNKQYTYSPYNSDTRRLQDHIQSAFIDVAYVDLKDIESNTLHHEGIIYTLIVSATLKRLVLDSKAGCIAVRVSFQKHVDEYVAVPNTRIVDPYLK